MALPVLATRMHRWDVSCLRIMNLKLSALCPLVPLSRAKGGSPAIWWDDACNASPVQGRVFSLPARRINWLTVQNVSAL